jgi:hypothetical protein
MAREVADNKSTDRIDFWRSAFPKDSCDSVLRIQFYWQGAIKRQVEGQGKRLQGSRIGIRHGHSSFSRKPQQDPMG